MAISLHDCAQKEFLPNVYPSVKNHQQYRPMSTIKNNVCSTVEARVVNQNHGLPGNESSRERKFLGRVMLKYAGEYCKYCEVGDASCQSCAIDTGMT